MMFFFRFVILFMLFLTGCSDKEDPMKDVESSPSQPPETNELPAEVENEDIYPLIVNRDSFIEVIDWYDDQSILYMTDENGESRIKRYNIVTKEEEDFFSIDEPIMSVTANRDRSKFAVQTASYTGGSPLYIVDRDGNMQFSSTEMGEAFSLFWNPYDKEQLLIVSYLPDWEYEVLLLTLGKNELKSVAIKQTFFQWIDKEAVAFLNWAEDEPSFHAPLHLLQLNTGEESKLHDNIIGMFSFANHVYFTVTVDTKYDLLSRYTFYKNSQKLSEVDVPILNTYSEQWWIPFHDFDVDKELFYYLSPHDSADFFEYHDGFQLTAFDIKTGKKTGILELTENTPLKLSPNGKRILYGNQLEQLIEIKTKKVAPIVEFY